MGLLLFLMTFCGVIALVISFSRIADLERSIERLRARIEILDRRTDPVQAGGTERRASEPTASEILAQRAAALARPAPTLVSDPVEEIRPPETAPAVPSPPAEPAAPARTGPARVTGIDVNRGPVEARDAPDDVVAAEATRAGSPAAPGSAPNLVDIIADRVRSFSLPKRTLSFEELVGSKLPIWIGGIALIFAGFFLVRYSIEAGLLGPGVRSVMAAVFGIALLVASEAARRIPRFAEDPRVGQALAGAGIASLYGTLYMAGQLYHLINPMTAFILMAIVTAGALFLSLRHGPPTAIMGLVGGFTAPFMAAPSGNLVPLFLYLGLLIAGLFAVSVHRGWRWLAFAATGGGVLWSAGIMFAKVSGIGPSLGIFIVAVAIGATMLFPKSGINQARQRLLPMVVGFIQLAIFAPMIDFDASGWGLYALLSAASLYLGWRDEKLMPANLAALGLVLILLYGAFDTLSPLAPYAAIGATLLFAVPGHLFARRSGTTQLLWTILALVGGAAPLFIASFADPDALSDIQWGLLYFAAAGPAAWLSWRARAEGKETWGRQTSKPDLALFGGGTLAALLVYFGLGALIDELWLPAGGFAIMMGLAAWAWKVKDRALRMMSLVFGGVAMLTWLVSLLTDSDVVDAIFSDAPIPPAEPMLALLAAPALLFAGTAWFHRERRADFALRGITVMLVIGIALALVPALWHTAAVLAIGAGLALWHHRLGDAPADTSTATFTEYASLTSILIAAPYWFGQLIARPEIGNAVAMDGPMPDPLPLFALLALPAALIAAIGWAHQRRRAGDALRWLPLGLAVALMLALVPFAWQPAALAAAFAGAALAGGRLPLPKFGLEAMLGVVGLYMLNWIAPYAEILLSSLAGETLHFATLPAMTDALIALGLPSLILGGAARQTRDNMDKWLGIALRGVTGVSAGAIAYHLAKTPLAIGSDAAFTSWGYTERALITQTLFVIGAAIVWRGGEGLRRAALVVLGVAAARFIWFDLLILNPLSVEQHVGALPLLNAVTLHNALVAAWVWWLGKRELVPGLRFAAFPLTALSLAFTVRQAFQGSTLDERSLGNGENYGYSAAFLLLAIAWLWRGIAGGARWLRMTGLALLTLVTLKVFLIDAAALEGLLRVLSFLGLGAALIGIGWVYTKVLSKEAGEAAAEAAGEASETNAS